MRISGVQIPDRKHVFISLTYVFGIGRAVSKKLLGELSIPLDKNVADIPDVDQKRIQEYIADHIKIEGDLRRSIQMDIKRLQEIGSWRGYRHRKGLTVRGQTTKRNCRTRRGRKKLAISGTTSKKSAEKT